MEINMILILGAVLVAIASSASTWPRCACDSIQRPVCGSDLITYENECSLRCAQQSNQNIIIQHQGACEPRAIARPAIVKREPLSGCICTRDLEPVCGTDGVTYNNPCLLRCAAMSIADLRIQQLGPCDIVSAIPQPINPITPSWPNCVCDRDLRPVCASDGNTYNNECLMRCAGVSLRVAHIGACVDRVRIAIPEPVCICPHDLRPVCGSDGVTYNNRCLLRCSRHSIRMVREGAC